MENRLIKRLDGLYQSGRYRIFSGSTLKLIALLTMLIDHTAFVLLSQMPSAITAFTQIGSQAISIYEICRMIGRIAFPIYCFLITEGYLHTHDKYRYGVNLLIFAVISEIPWDLEHTGDLTYGKQNVFFTLFLGYLAICLYEKYQHDRVRQLLYLTGLFLLTFILNADYGSTGLLFILFLYIMRNMKVPRALIGCCFFENTWAILAAFIPITMYNGKRGFIKGKAAKYLFYAAYPVHILILYLIRQATFGYK